jgi:hypothetical protein
MVLEVGSKGLCDNPYKKQAQALRKYNYVMLVYFYDGRWANDFSEKPGGPT